MRDTVADVLSATARELEDLDLEVGGVLDALGAAVAARPGSAPYVEAILGYLRDAFLICECGEDTTDELFLVRDDVWLEAYPNGAPQTNPCLSCLEDALGRDLEPADFADDPINDAERLRSPRLLERMGLDSA